MQHNWRHSQPRLDYFHVCSILGPSVLLDAAQFNSGAHRLRNFWTNLCSPSILTAIASSIIRSPHATAKHLLPFGVWPQLSKRDDTFPF